MRISFLNNKFINHQDAFIHIEDRSVQFGDSVYEVILFKNNKLIDAKPHLERLFQSLEKVNIKHNFLQDEIEKNMLELFKRNNLNDGSIYLQISRGVFNRVPWVPTSEKEGGHNFIMTVSPLKTFSKQEFTDGLNLITHEDIRWHRVDIKTTCLLASSMVNQKAKDLGYNDALFVRNGIVTEATYANFFFFDQEDNLITKKADNFILNGITRQRIIALAKENEINVVEKDFGMDEVFQAKEAFLSSSTLKIRPINSIDDNVIGQKSRGLVAKLSQYYDEFIDNF
jgi:D-alanine transaminase